MVERRQEHRRHTRRRRQPSNLYDGVFRESDPGVLAAAAQAKGLDDEVALVRVLLRRHLAEHPENLELTIKGMHLLERKVTAQEQLSGVDAAALEEQSRMIADQMTAALLGKEAADG